MSGRMHRPASRHMSSKQVLDIHRIGALTRFRHRQPVPSQYRSGGSWVACLLPSAGDCNNIILGVPRPNHKVQDRFKDNIIKQKFG